jgi:hypothetical protein
MFLLLLYADTQYALFTKLDDAGQQFYSQVYDK